MTKTIDTLIEDIEKVFKEHHEFDTDTLASFGQRLAATIASRINQTSGGGTLRLSNIGTPCERKLWYSVNEPEKGEDLPFNARVKFLFGDILEELLLWLAEEAGHKVEHRQEEVVVNGVVGHIDAVIDGVLIDCKSASTYSYNKFKSGGLEENDPFGYVDQLGSYYFASNRRGLVSDNKRYGFLVIDKTLGNICLDMHQPKDVNYDKVVETKRAVVNSSKLPSRAYFDEADGKSGNRKLSVGCSYCSFKSHCWPSLRAFAYSTGPRWLTHVAELPRVPEITKEEEYIESS